jgi:hypothetical protein
MLIRGLFLIKIFTIYRVPWYYRILIAYDSLKISFWFSLTSNILLQMLNISFYQRIVYYLNNPKYKLKPVLWRDSDFFKLI